MAISYEKTNWVNGSSPAINADNLNKIETGIKNATDEVNSKQDKLTAGENITIENNVISSAAGLPEGTEAGQALIYNGDEWQKQDGYAYKTETVLDEAETIAVTESNYVPKKPRRCLKESNSNYVDLNANNNLLGLKAFLVDENVGKFVKVIFNDITYITEVLAYSEGNIYIVSNAFNINEWDNGNSYNLAVKDESLTSVTIATASLETYQISPEFISEDGYGYIGNKSKKEFSISWDGDTTGKASIDNLVYKVSDLVLTGDDILGCTGIAELDGEQISLIATTDNTIVSEHGGYCLVEEMPAVVFSDGSLIVGETQVGAGVWFLKFDRYNAVVTGLTSIHKIDSKFIEPELPKTSTAGTAAVYNGENWVAQEGYGYEAFVDCVPATEITLEKIPENNSKLLEKLADKLGRKLSAKNDGEITMYEAEATGELKDQLLAILTPNKVDKSCKVSIDDVSHSDTIKDYVSWIYYIGNLDVAMGEADPQDGDYFVLAMEQEGGYVARVEYWSSTADETITIDLGIQVKDAFTFNPELISKDGYGYVRNNSKKEFSITWDGNIEGKESVFDDLYKVSDLVLTGEDILGCVGTALVGENTASITATTDNTVISEHGGYCTYMEERAMIFSDGSLVIDETTVGAGIWFAKFSSYAYMTGLTSVHKIDSKYIPDPEPELPKATTAGTAAIYNGDEWIAQDGYAYKEPQEQEEITWDGDITGKDSFHLPYGGIMADYYRVSDKVFSDFYSLKSNHLEVTVSDGSQTQRYQASLGHCIHYDFAYMLTDSGYRIISGDADGVTWHRETATTEGHMVIVPTAKTLVLSAQDQTITVNLVPGVYFSKFVQGSEFAYISTFTYTEADVVNKISPELISKDGYGYALPDVNIDITWDGDITGKDVVSINGEKYYKLSDDYRPYTDYLGGEFKISSSETPVTITDEVIAKSSDKYFYGYGNGYILGHIAYMCIIVSDGTFSLLGRTFGKGIWFRKTDSWYASKLYRVAANRFSQIDSKYLTAKQDKLTAGTGITIENNVISSTGGGGLPEGTEASQALIWNGTEWTKQSGYGYETMATIVTDQAFDFTASYSIATTNAPLTQLLHNSDNLGKSVVITYDGTEYTGVIKSYNGRFNYVGNLSIRYEGEEDTGEPFICLNYSDEPTETNVRIKETETAGSHVFTIKAQSVITIDNKFIENGDILANSVKSEGIGYGGVLNAVNEYEDTSRAAIQLTSSGTAIEGAILYRCTTDYMTLDAISKLSENEVNWSMDRGVVITVANTLGKSFIVDNDNIENIYVVPSNKEAVNGSQGVADAWAIMYTDTSENANKRYLAIMVKIAGKVLDMSDLGVDNVSFPTTGVWSINYPVTVNENKISVDPNASRLCIAKWRFVKASEIHSIDPVYIDSTAPVVTIADSQISGATITFTTEQQAIIIDPRYPILGMINSSLLGANTQYFVRESENASSGLIKFTALDDTRSDNGAATVAIITYDVDSGEATLGRNFYVPGYSSSDVGKVLGVDSNNKLDWVTAGGSSDSSVVYVDTYSALPATGAAGKIYITKDTNRQYRWIASGTQYTLNTNVDQTTFTNVMSALGVSYFSPKYLYKNSAYPNNSVKVGGYNPYGGTYAITIMNNNSAYGEIHNYAASSHNYLRSNGTLTTIYELANESTDLTAEQIATLTNNGIVTISALTNQYVELTDIAAGSETPQGVEYTTIDELRWLRVRGKDYSIPPMYKAGTGIVSLSGGNDTISVDTSAIQEKLVSGTNIKTINNESLLGEGNITISGGEPASYIKDASASGNTLTLTKKDDSTVTFNNTTYSAGTNVTISADNKISATDTKYTQGSGITISGTTISADTSVVQAKLVSGTNIKTVNGQSILSGGNITAVTSLGGTYGDIAINTDRLTLEESGEGGADILTTVFPVSTSRGKTISKAGTTTLETGLGIGTGGCYMIRLIPQNDDSMTDGQYPHTFMIDIDPSSTLNQYSTAAVERHNSTWTSSLTLNVKFATANNFGTATITLEYHKLNASSVSYAKIAAESVKVTKLAD